MSSSEDETECPLCSDKPVTTFHQDNTRTWLRCRTCRLIFVPPVHHLSAAEEKQVYDHHENSPHDERYRRFLSRLFNPVDQRITPGSSGLDFGSGPGPALSVMFQEAGHNVEIYDPYYAPDTRPLEQQYDFVTASEVVEHFRDPQLDLNRMWACVKPGGLLGIMTKRATDREAFATWHYKNDPTHVSFYSIDTFSWLANAFRFSATQQNDIVTSDCQFGL